MSNKLNSVRDYNVYVNNGATAEFAGNTVTLKSLTVGSQVALTKAVRVKPFETVKYQVIARAISAEHVGIAYLNLTIDGVKKIVDNIAITDTEWQIYDLIGIMPINAKPTDFLEVGVGVATAEIGEINVISARVDIVRETTPTAKIMAMAMFTSAYADGVRTTSIHKGYDHTGIFSCEYVKASKSMQIKISPTAASIGLFPVVMSNMVKGNYDTYTVVAGGFQPVEGIVNLYFYDNGVLADLDALDKTFYFNILCVSS